MTEQAITCIEYGEMSELGEDIITEGLHNIIKKTSQKRGFLWCSIIDELLNSIILESDHINRWYRDLFERNY